MNDYLEFGEYLLDSYDLDPLYVILASVSWPEKVMKTFLLGYYIFYSAGVACKIAEAKNPYSEMFAQDYQHAPRGHERRHMRGQQFEDTVNGLKQFGSPEKVIDYMMNGTDFQTISKNVQAFRGFGPWISFKIFDMMDRVLQLPTNKTGMSLYMYKDPVKGAALYKFRDQNHPITEDEVNGVVHEFLHMFRKYKAPPYQDRSLSVMEIETILCKSKSNYNGHYPLGCDTVEIYHGLNDGCDLAQELQKFLQPYYDLWKDVPWDQRNVRIAV